MGNASGGRSKAKWDPRRRYLRGVARPRAADDVNSWDLAGAFTLIGCAATILGEIELVLEFIGPLPSTEDAPD
jgi:hypothetical protein